MAKKTHINGRNFKFAQSCDGRQCRKEFKDDIIKGFSETVTTPHEYNGGNKTVTCLYCGKVTKLK